MADAADCFWMASSTSGKRCDAPWTKLWPAKVQPIVPLRKALTGLGIPALINDCVPMMLRVRPAQLTMMRVVAFGAMARARKTNSAPGTLTPLGMLMVWYSSKRRLSRTTTSALESIKALTSCADRDGVWRTDSTNSPNDLLGTLTSRNSSPPPSFHPCKPPANIVICV